MKGLHASTRLNKLRLPAIDSIKKLKPIDAKWIISGIKIEISNSVVASDRKKSHVF